MPHASALLVIDMQNDPVSLAYRATETVAAIAGLRERAKAAGTPVVIILDQGDETEAGTGGRRAVPELAPAADEVVIHKTSPDSFLDTGLDKVLKELGATEVVVTGFATEICVETTARQALSHRYDLVMVADGHTTSVRPDTGEFASPQQSIAHHNEIYRHLAFPGRRIRVLNAADVDFAPRAVACTGSPQPAAASAGQGS
ncbi:isochorismatase family protein [Streptomyces sp. NPDC051322]|uniref:cysteine hydrolase family protein n=1 Tax=Streptomyces sp. NPDC051322 TaxID=3154645 RepID=UPI00344D726F